MLAQDDSLPAQQTSRSSLADDSPPRSPFKTILPRCVQPVITRRARDQKHLQRNTAPGCFAAPRPAISAVPESASTFLLVCASDHLDIKSASSAAADPLLVQNWVNS